MSAAYPEWDYKGRDVVAQTATKLYHARPIPSRLSPLIFMTDPERVTDIIGSAENLPRGAAIIFRHFGSAHKFVDAEALREVTFKREQQFLIGDDPQLAIDIGADGVHFRRDCKALAPALWRQRCPDWIISMAGIKSGEYQGDLTVLDGLLVSSVFQSQSPSAGKPMGLETFSNTSQNLEVPVFALGGVNKTTAPKLLGSGAAGVAGIEFGA